MKVTMPNATNVSATDGLVGGVDVSWTQPNNAKAAQVWRSTVKGQAGTLVATLARGPYHDATAVAGTIYWFGIKLQGPSGPFGSLSAQDSGSAAALPPPPSPPVIVTQSIPAGQVNVSYTTTLVASGGKPPYVWSVVSGALPGLTLATSGVLNSGAPSVSGAFSFTAKVTDANGLSATQAYSLSIAAAPPPPPPPPGQVGLASKVSVGQAFTLGGQRFPGSKDRQTIVDGGGVSGYLSGYVISGSVCYGPAQDTSTPQWYFYANNAWSFTPSQPPEFNGDYTLPDVGPPTPPSNGPFFLNGVAYGTLQQAHDASSNGDTIKVRYSPAPYVIGADGSGPSPVTTFIKNGLTVEWETPGLMPKFDISAWAQGATTHGGRGAAFDVHPACTSLTLRGLDVTGFQAPGQGDSAFCNIESGYPYPYPNSVPYTVLIEFCAMRKFSNGVFCGHNENGFVTVRNSLIEDCMAGDGTSHGMYISAINTLLVEGNTFRTTASLGFNEVPPSQASYGHLLKSRARNTTLLSNLFDGRSGCARNVDICNGGTLIAKGNIFHKYGDDMEANQCLAFGREQRLNPGQLDPASGFPTSFDNTGFTLTFCHDGRVHSIFLAQNTMVDEWSNGNLLLIDQIPDDNKNIITIPKTVRNNIAAGPLASGITAFPNNSEVQVSQINSSGRLTIPEIIGTQNDATGEYAGLFAAPTLRVDACCGAFEESVVAGSVPSWLSVPVQQWADVPGSRPSDYLKNDGTGALPAAFMAGSGNQEPNYRQCDSYGGPCWSEKNKELHRFGGGHAATNMNPLVKAELNLESPRWVARDPGSTGGLTGTIQTDWDSGTWDASAYHSDGRPKSTHAYRGNHYLDSIDEFLQVACGAGNSPLYGHLDRPDVAGFANGAWRPQGYWPSLPVEGQGYTETVQCTDPNGNGVYIINLGNPLRRLDAATRQISQIGGDYHNWMGGNSDCTKMGAKAGQICAVTFIGDVTSPYSLRYIDTATGVETPLTLSGAAFPLRTDGWRPVEMVWADAVNKWYVAFNQDDGNFGSSPWPLYSITPTSANTATVELVSVTGAPPTSGVRRGLYYSRDWKCLIAYNGFANAIKVLRVA